MKHIHSMHLLVVVALIALVALTGCPKQPAGDTGADLPMAGEPAPPDEGGEPDTPDVPTSASTLGEAMAGFNLPSSFEMTMVQGGDEDMPQSMIMKMDGTELVAMKATSDEGTMLLDVEGAAMYIVDPEDNTALKMPMDEDEAGDLPNPYELNEEKDAKVVGSETIDGVDCWVIVPADEDEEGKAWIGKSDGLLRQVEEDDGELIQISYTRINAVPDSEFELPDGVEIEDMAAMFDGMPDEGDE